MFYDSIKSYFHKELSRFTSIGELSRFSGVPKTTLYRWATGAGTPTLRELSQIADCLGYKVVPPDCNCRDDETDYLSIPVIRYPHRLK